MRVERVPPDPPAPLFQLTFERDDGWPLVAALREYADNHRGAVRRDSWLAWAEELDRLLRSGT